MADSEEELEDAIKRAFREIQRSVNSDALRFFDADVFTTLVIRAADTFPEVAVFGAMQREAQRVADLDTPLKPKGQLSNLDLNILFTALAGRVQLARHLRKGARKADPRES